MSSTGLPALQSVGNVIRLLAVFFQVSGCMPTAKSTGKMQSASNVLSTPGMLELLGQAAHAVDMLGLLWLFVFVVDGSVCSERPVAC